MTKAKKVQVKSLHKDFVAIGAVVEVTPDEAKLMVMIGRAEMVRGGHGPKDVKARILAPVTKAA
jgi:hypothetical protein